MSTGNDITTKAKNSGKRRRFERASAYPTMSGSRRHVSCRSGQRARGHWMFFVRERPDLVFSRCRNAGHEWAGGLQTYPADATG